jgi:hypothetical protein
MPIVLQSLGQKTAIPVEAKNELLGQFLSEKYRVVLHVYVFNTLRVTKIV